MPSFLLELEKEPTIGYIAQEELGTKGVGRDIRPGPQLIAKYKNEAGFDKRCAKVNKHKLKRKYT